MGWHKAWDEKRPKLVRKSHTICKKEEFSEITLHSNNPWADEISSSFAHQIHGFEVTWLVAQSSSTILGTHACGVSDAWNN